MSVNVEEPPVVIGLGGTRRPGSSSERALFAALDGARRQGARTQAFTAADLDLPFYDPSDSSRSEKACRLVEAFRVADGMIIASPGYHGAVSGLLKNALDYAEDLVADDRVYLAGLPVGCIGVAYGNQAAASVLSGLRTIVHALRAFPTPYGAAVVSHSALWDGDLCTDTVVGEGLAMVGEQTAEYAALCLARPRLARKATPVSK